MSNEFNNSDDCLEPGNSSCSQVYCFGVVYVLLYVFTAVVAIFTVLGNLLVIIAVYHFKQLHTPTNVLIASLAISDCLVGVFVIPAHFVLLIESCLLLESTFCSFYNVLKFQLTFVSIYNIAFIAVDRYFALSNPFLYSKKVSLSLAFIVTTLLWIVSLFYNCMALYFYDNFRRKCPDRCLPSVNEVLGAIDLVIVFILPCSIIVILYLKVFFIARRHAVLIRAACKNRKQIQNSGESGDSMRLERKAAKVLGILVSVFLMCLIPYYICLLLTDVSTQVYGSAVNASLTVLILNSSINPVIYALFYPWFQRSIILIVTFRICRPDTSLINVHGRKC